MMGLYYFRRGFAARDRLDNIPITKAPGQEPGLARALCRLLKNLNEGASDGFSFLLGIGHTPEAAQKKFGCIHVLQFHFEVPAEYFSHDACFWTTQQSIVYENA